MRMISSYSSTLKLTVLLHHQYDSLTVRSSPCTGAQHLAEALSLLESEKKGE